jgi:uncharacterized protein YeaO (DUF488 family)
MSKNLKLGTYRCGSPRGEGEGLRIGTVRYLPRGVRKEEYARKDYFDVWLPAVAPSAKLIRSYRDGRLSWKSFEERYRGEMRKSTDARQTITLISEIAKRTPISIGCYCEDEGRCHRSVLRKAIEEA